MSFMQDVATYFNVECTTKKIHKIMFTPKQLIQIELLIVFKDVPRYSAGEKRKM